MGSFFSPLEQFNAITIFSYDLLFDCIYDLPLLSVLVPFILILCLVDIGMDFFEVDFKLVPDI
jgi:hypothetical protein